MASGSELTRIFFELKSKSTEIKEKAAEDLASFYCNNTDQSEDIFLKIQKQINLQDYHEKLGGLIAAGKLIHVIPEQQLLTFVSRFFSGIFEQFKQQNEHGIYTKAAEVFGELIRLGGQKFGFQYNQLQGTKFAVVIESDVDEALRWLRGDTNKDWKKLSAILALKQLLIQAPYITFTRIFNQGIQFIWNLIRDKREQIRTQALDFVNECIRQISQRETQQQQEWLTKIYNEILKQMLNTEADVIHSNILVLKSILTHAKEEIFAENFEEICTYILSKRETKNSMIQKAVIQTIPILLKFSKQVFIQKFLLQSIKFLLIYSNQIKLQKDKSLCYLTLADVCNTLDEATVKQYVVIVVKNILDELQAKSKPMCVETLNCLYSIVQKFKVKIAEYIDLQILIDSILLNGLNKRIIVFLNQLSKLNIPLLSEYVQCKLLLTISTILIGKPQIIYKDTLDKMILSRFSYSLQEEANNLPEFKNDEAISLAIKTLCSFDFSAYQDYLGNFVKENVIPQLDNPNALIRKAAAQASCLLYDRRKTPYYYLQQQQLKSQMSQQTFKQSIQQQQKMTGSMSVGKLYQPSQQMSAMQISNNFMVVILDKFMSVAISDPDDEIRVTMLASLNSNFDYYLNSTSNLKKFFQCAYDPNIRVQKLALSILCRLSRDNPSDIYPFLKKMLFQNLSSLILDDYLQEKQKIQLINQLTVLIAKAKDLVLPHTEMIAPMLLNYVKQSSHTHLIPQILKGVKMLWRSGKWRLQEFEDETVYVLLELMQDKAFSEKRRCAIKTFIEVVKSTNFVILPYFKHPTLLEKILMLLKIESEANVSLRGLLLRLMGVIGAVDYFSFKKALLNLKECVSDANQARYYSTEDVKNYSGIRLKFLKNIDSKQIQQQQHIDGQQLMSELYNFYDDLILFEKGKDQQKIILHLAKVSSEQKRKYKEKEKEKWQKEDTSSMAVEKVNEGQLEELLYGAVDIELNNPDYFYLVAIRTFLKVLVDNSLANYHDLAIDTLKVILTQLKGRCSHFLYVLFPVFLGIIEEWERYNQDKSEKIFEIIEKVIGFCEREFGMEYVNVVLNLVKQYFKETRLVRICLKILDTLILVKKSQLKFKVEPIVNIVNTVLNGGALGIVSQNTDEQLQYNALQKEVIIKVLKIITNLREFLEPYLQKVVPSLCKLLSQQSQQYFNADVMEIWQNVLELVKGLVKSCSDTTVQFLSLLVPTLLKVIEACQSGGKDWQVVINLVMEIFVLFLLTYHNDFLIYLPLVNSIVRKYKIYNNEYKSCINNLLMYNNLEEISKVFDEQGHEFSAMNAWFGNNAGISALERSNLQNTTAPGNITMGTGAIANAHYQQIAASADQDYQPYYRKIDPESIKVEFDVSRNLLRQEWIEWMRKSSLELLKQSPNPVICPCLKLAEVYSRISQEMYNIAFASCWQFFNDKQKEFVIKQLHIAINAANIPTQILQTILDLSEFMQHDRLGLQIDNSTLGDLAERCQAYAKALYYREQEFETANEKTVESLLSLYTNLGQPEAATGLLKYAKNILQIELNMSWHEKLQRWEDALNEYRLKVLRGQEDYFVPKLRCLSALSEWEIILSQCEGQLQMEKQQNVGWLAANAALNLGEWEKLEQWVEQLNNEDEFEFHFLTGIVNIKNQQYEPALQCIESARKSLDSKVTGLLLESYGRAYDNIVKLQQLSEMEEIIEVKQFKTKRNEEWLKESGQQIIEKELEELTIYIKDRWQKRLQGCERRVDVWQKILSVRGLLFNKVENIKGWLGLAKMALEAQQMQLAKRVVDQLKKEWEALYGPKRHPAELIMMELECDYRREVIKDVELMNKVGAFLNEREELSFGQRARCFSKLGYWLKERNEDFNLVNLQQICQIFEQSISHDPKYYKGWNQYAYTNFEIVQIYEHENDKEPNEETKNARNKYIFQAIRGFLKAIALEARNAFQDSLRLLTLIFKYGDQEGIGNEVRENLKSIDIVSWVEVIPQIIARIDIPNQAIQTLLQDLMIHISAEHPQALIYQLTVTSKSKVENRVKASAKIVEFIKEKNPQLVSEAMIISEELIKTAILLKELWYEGIESAWTMYSHNKNIRQTVIALRALNEKTRASCQSQNEIAFHQSMGHQIFSAEQWLNQYDFTKDENCLNQAFDIYYHVYYKIKEQLEDMKMVFLENVSPKLYSLKNCEISIPGLYRTNQSIVRIAGFCAKLVVLSSKQRPRKIFIYGSDEKEYTFLLKGHEDMRQDERAMQLFSLVNRLLNNNHETQKKDLIITRYDVVPLSTNTGIIGWVQNSDPLQQLIKTYRESSNIIQSTEFMLMKSMCAQFQFLPLANKVEIYRYILENTKGEDLQKVLWLKSPNSEIWLERRTNYTRSLATMSMVGYILGLGDRHPSNIMLNKSTGRIIHIDFGDCWEVAMKREKYPEKVPFRLTRMLVKAMEACGIEGNYRHTSEIVMQVLRDNKESLMAVLEAFVYDPLLHWRLFTEEEVVAQRAEGGGNIEEHQEAQSMLRGLTLATGVKQLGIQHQEEEEEKISEQKIEIGSMENQQKKPANQQQPQFIEEVAQEQGNLAHNQPKEVLNKKALDILDRIKKKLVGKDFKENESLSVKDQVNKLIRQATSHENISQAYLGWCPFW